MMIDDFKFETVNSEVWKRSTNKNRAENYRKHSPFELKLLALINYEFTFFGDRGGWSGYYVKLD